MPLGSGVSASVFVESGAGIASGVGKGTGTTGITYERTGAGIAGMPGLRGTAKAGYAVAGLVGSGVSESVFVEAASGIAGLVGAGESASVFVEAGAGVAGAVGSGPSASEFVEAGYGVAGLVGSGVSALSSGAVYTKSGYGTVSSDGPEELSAAVGDTETLTSGLNVHDGTVMAKGMLFGITNTTPAKIVRWSDPLNDLSTYTSQTFANDGKHIGSSADCIVYDENADLLYVCFSSHGDELGGDNFHVLISTVDPDDITSIGTLVDVDTGSIVSQGFPALLLTGGFLYMMTGPSLENSRLFKIDPSDGSVDDDMQLTGTNRVRGHGFATDDTRLYFSGTKIAGGAEAWCGWAELDFSAHDTLTLGTNIRASDDITVIGDSFFVNLEQETTPSGTVKKVATDLSGVDDIPIGYLTGVDGQFYDGEYLWVTSNGDLTGGGSQPSAIVALDPDTGDVFFSFQLSSGQTNTNEIFRVDDTILLVTYQQPAQAYRVDLTVVAAGLLLGVRAMDHIRSGSATVGLVGAGGSASEFVEEGFGVAGAIGAGASESVFVEAGSGSVGADGSGSSASVFVESGYGVVGAVGSGVSVGAGVREKAGYGAAGVDGYGSSASVFVEEGAATAGLVGAGESASVFQETGAGVAGTAGYGAEARDRIREGAGVVGLIGSGTRERERDRAGYGTAGAVGSGESVFVFQETGTGVAGTVATGESASVFVESGYGAVGANGYGTSARAGIIVKAGAGIAGLVGSGLRNSVTTKKAAGTVGVDGYGAGASVFQETGYGTVGAVGSGSTETATVHDKAGYGSVGTVGSGGKTRDRIKAGYGTVGVTAAGSRQMEHTRQSAGIAGLVGAGVRNFVYTESGYAILEGTGSGVVIREVNRSGHGIVGLTGTGDTRTHFDAADAGYISREFLGQIIRSSEGVIVRSKAGSVT